MNIIFLTNLWGDYMAFFSVYVARPITMGTYFTDATVEQPEMEEMSEFTVSETI